ncbi:MAG TPA: glutamate mutase L, partial [Nocardioides sp.]|nr:glutamate mutase L [Nocardioides sp.]
MAEPDRVVACVDFGSTFTKAALVEVPSGRLLATAEHRTTIDTDVLDGWDACRAELAAADARAADAEVLACSSAGGGLRIAVVGNEELVTAEAGRRVALSSGGRVVHVAHGRLTRAEVTALRAARPDVLLLVGGTDGGNQEVLLESATTLAKARWRRPVVVAGNADARDDVAKLLDDAGTPYVLADNVVPRIGVLAPESARAAIREMFLRHVIGG